MQSGVELWGGLECSFVRVGDTVRDQIVETGHARRLEDIDRIADLGLTTVRYPVLWERNERCAGHLDWAWQDPRMARLRQRSLSPIAGLLHHGSGPSWCDLLHPDFAEAFAQYALGVAQRYPWIDRYTPINEPLTTARISGLYGLWHPHGTDEATFLRLVAAQCLATSKAMAAIRTVNPGALLVQTEDLGRVFATPDLQYQAAYENQRRWLAIDLLAGRVDRFHPFRDALKEAGVDAAHLDKLVAEPCPPDIVGLDYYLTSDRMLDQRNDLYPGERAGGNDRDQYVDVAAIRSDVPQRQCGLGPRLREVWERYGIPMAVTELHNGCTRDEQLRWLLEGWETANSLLSEGIDIRAVTSWSLFGSCDWNSMLVKTDAFYESGAFDCRHEPPLPTVLAQAISHLSRFGAYDHPILDQPGWWVRDNGSADARAIVLVGDGPLISTAVECCEIRRLPIVQVESDATSTQLFERHGAWAILRNRKAADLAMVQADLSTGGTLEAHLNCDDLRGGVNLFLDRMIDAWLAPPSASAVRAEMVERLHPPGL